MVEGHLDEPEGRPHFASPRFRDHGSTGTGAGSLSHGTSQRQRDDHNLTACAGAARETEGGRRRFARGYNDPVDGGVPATALHVQIWDQGVGATETSEVRDAGQGWVVPSLVLCCLARSGPVSSQVCWWLTSAVAVSF